MESQRCDCASARKFRFKDAQISGRTKAPRHNCMSNCKCRHARIGRHKRFEGESNETRKCERKRWQLCKRLKTQKREDAIAQCTKLLSGDAVMQMKENVKVLKLREVNLLK